VIIPCPSTRQSFQEACEKARQGKNYGTPDLRPLSAEWICSFRGVEADPIHDPLTEARPAVELYPLGEIDFI